MSGRSPHVVHVVATDSFAGVERYVSLVSARVAEAGWRVTVIGGDPTRMGEATADSGVRFVPHRSAVRTGTTLRRSDADLVHAHMTVAEFVSVVSTPRRVPVVSTRHFAARRGSSPAAGLVGRHITGRLAVEVAISPFVADHADGPTVLLAHGVPPQPLSTERERMVVVCQRLSPEKDTGLALEAWSRSGLDDRGWRLCIAGRGDERASLEKLACRLGIAASVDFVGFVDDSVSLMGRAGVVLATAPAEPFGLSVVEAMSTGAVVVAADGGAHGWLLDDDPTVLFPPGDVDGCAAALRRWCDSDATERAALGARLRDRQRDLFDLDRHVDGLVGIYADVLAGRVG